jgi:hypothetical protein
LHKLAPDTLVQSLNTLLLQNGEQTVKRRLVLESVRVARLKSTFYYTRRNPCQLISRKVSMDKANMYGYVEAVAAAKKH